MVSNLISVWQGEAGHYGHDDMADGSTYTCTVSTVSITIDIASLFLLYTTLCYRVCQ